MKNYEIEFEDEVYYLPQLDTKTVDKKRYYITPEGKEYPSITTVLSPRNKEGIMKWRKRVGEEVATHIASKAAVRGSKVHKMCEDWLSEDFSFETWEKHKKDFSGIIFLSRRRSRGHALPRSDGDKAKTSKVAITMVGIVADLHLFLNKSVDVAGKALKEKDIIFVKNS